MRATPNPIRCVISLAGLFLVGCTGQLKEAFRYAQQEQVFSSQLEVNTQVDLLWVVDNSASMDVSQDNLRKGFAAFAQKYMKPNWDIQVAVITTDTYLADPAYHSGLDLLGTPYTGYLDRMAVAGTYSSAWVQGHAAQWANPGWAPGLLDLGATSPTYGKFAGGVHYHDLVPAWFAYGASDPTITFARLLPGLHDGPIAALCTEDFPTRHFFAGRPKCSTRDFGPNTGPSHCLSPDTGAGETAISQCVNTVQNDTVRSGKAILRTMPPSGTPGNQAWIDQLVADFRVNITTGSAGHGSERGLESVLTLLKQNESTSTPFFRPGSTRGIIFVSDEDDQTLLEPVTAAELGTYKPNTDYRCDLAGTQALNGGNASPTCCSSGCAYQPFTLDGSGAPVECSLKFIDGTTRVASICPRQDKLRPVSSIKAEMDAFFSTLDGPQGDPTSYFVSVITPLTLASIQAMQASRDTEDAAAAVQKIQAVDRGDRYLELADLVAAPTGKPAVKMDIGSSDYGPVLEAVGRAIVEKKSSFTLSREPTGSEDMIVAVLHADGTRTLVSPAQYTINGRTLTVTDLDLVLAFASTDRVLINYQPKTAG